MIIVAIFTLIGIIGVSIFLTLLVMKYILKIDLFSYLPSFLLEFADKYSLWFGFIVAFMATFGSLYFSEVQGLEPCRMCWYQRIFMYPLTLIFLVSAIKKDKSVIKYILPIAWIGLLVAGLQVYMQLFPDSSLACSVGEVSCSDPYVTYFGFITIPLMSLVSFVLVVLASLYPHLSLYKRE